jgi:uncharacterized phiE125 gp8 family phage protein
MTLSLVTAPTVEPLTVADIEQQCRTGAGGLAAESVLVGGYISAVRQKAEVALRRQLITATWNLTLDAFPAPSRSNPFALIEIPLPPLQSVVSVKYLSVDNTLITLDPSLYVVDLATPGRIIPAYGQTWPATLDFPGTVRVQFVAGYGDSAEDVPDCIKTWMLLNVANLYENRESESVSDSRMSQIDLTTMADSLLDPERWEVRV